MSNTELLENNDEEITEPVEPTEPENPDPDTPDEPDVPDEPVEPEAQWYYQTIPNFYNRVRSSLNAHGISDSVIDYFENAPMAEIKMKQRVPDWAELDDTNTLLFQTCIIYMACYALCPIASSMRISRQKDPSLEIEFAATTQKDNPCERFLALIDDLVSQINGEELQNCFGFKVTAGSGYTCVKPCWPYRHSQNAYDPL